MPNCTDDTTTSPPDSGDQPWAGLYPEARRRYFADPLLSLRVRTAVDLLARDRRDHGGTFTTRDDETARMAAALALVIAERPDLLGARPERRAPTEIVARFLAPLLRGTGQLHRLEELSRLLLQALEVDGWEIGARADRFAHLERDARRLRIPLRGRCGICLGDVDRAWETIGADAELLIGPWRHSYRQNPHPDAEITDVEPR